MYARVVYVAWLSLAISTIAAGEAPAGSPVAAHGQLRVSGSRLLDGAGQPVR
eukprot:CAMPEP_0198493882 /NCGR_PEP_ID=MMETSP1462-20131121/4289_1 /TAXON_ID=1333877 /ORGANISM="Brandtodinium nutriculum, Strain RCC3387" /LENGTH=51 /DNA_ID=CAMNT_0044222595 /DNA_START=77 /DNA_END=228 /DNA_ORIENTATION=+